MSYESSLVLKHVVFEKIAFNRIDFQKASDIEYRMQIQIGQCSQDGEYKVSLILEGNKVDEYTFQIGLAGFFSVELQDGEEQQINVEDLLKRNAVAILMPYLRSEVTLLTSQPETEPVVLPVFNINAMIDAAD